jgi:phospholipase A1
MDAVILLPGITGSSLDLNNQEIWPPNLDEVGSHYKRLPQLLNDQVKVGKIIKWVIAPCAKAYAPLIQDLNDICFQSGFKYVEFPYDWRQDLVDSANKLGIRLDQLVKNDRVSGVTLVCHSMGGLIARILLEAPKKKGTRPRWKGKVNRLLCICTPHLGAPKVLSRCMGLEGESTITKEDVKILCDSTKYPAAYQLLPPESKTIVWDVKNPRQRQPIDIYGGEGARLSLSADNLAKAQKSFLTHNLDNRPNEVEYTFIFGTDHVTEEEFDLEGTTITPKTNSLGDGTVPIWSASFTGTRPGIMTWSTPGDHVGILAVQNFKDFLYGYFGMAAPFRVQKARDENVAVLSPNKREYAPDEIIELLIIPDRPISTAECVIELDRYDVSQRQLIKVRSLKPLNFQGGPTKVIHFGLAAPTEPGGYRLTMNGTHKTIEGTHAWFIVTDTARRDTEIKRSGRTRESKTKTRKRK